ncbi:MAG TPA: sigma-70 family RNA polymerase sigma factor [Vicinamibacterales bacterium]|nr:sigma-70 family RNA polymerase sigma factor [Vicinamibacterales bacterium]
MFPVTRTSVIADLGSVDPEARAAAYEALARSYWQPVYAYVRLRRRRSPEDAQDLTQEFFTRAFEREYLERYDPSKARFRTFVRTCLDGFLANADKSAARLKRGGGFAIDAVDFARFDEDLAAHARSDDPDPERWFHREWVRALFSDALDRLRVHCGARGHARAFTLFTRYDIEPESSAARPTYATLARESGIAVTDVTNELAWARRAFREIVLERLRTVCASDAEFRTEARDLLGINPP